MWSETRGCYGLAPVVTKDAAGNVSVGPAVLHAAAGMLAPVTVAASSPQNPAATGFYYNNSAGAMTFNLPAITSATVGLQLCFRNAATRTGALTLRAPSATYIDLNGATGAAAGALVSAGALGDAACVVAVSTTLYAAYPGSGTWTNE